MALEILNTDWSMTCKWDGDPKTRAFDKPPVILMYCVVAYPASGVDLYQINNLKQIFDIQVGYSDHSTDIETIPPVSFSHGSCLIEKHFTIIPCVATPDQPHSLNPDQFKRMSFCIRNRKYPPIHSYGWHSEFKGSTPEEKTALLRYSRRLIAIKDLHPGDTLTEGVNFGIYRSLVDDTRAAHPFMIDQFIGRTVKRELKAGQGLWFEDINT
jgi:sialic acid synthase SpsE